MIMSKKKRTGKNVSRSAKFRKYTLCVLIGGLIVSSLISIVAILIGEFSDTIRRALFTTVLMVVHALVALAFVSVEPGKDKFSSALITNTSFAIVVASFFTSVLGTWEIIAGSTVREFYTTYVLAFLTTLMASVILQLRRETLRTRALAFTSTGILVFMYALVQPWIFADDNSSLPEIYFRTIGATAVLFVTCIVLTTISYRLYAAKHRTTSHRTPLEISGWGWAIIIIVFFLFGLPLLEMLEKAFRGM
jgi:FtsH-binding integral membrane protein